MRDEFPTERWIAELATRQHGVVARRQLLEGGVSRSAIGRWIERGRLHPVYRGVYAVGHRVLGPHGRWMAAVLACGEGAVLSHGSAAAAWKIRGTGAAIIDLTVPGDGGRRVRGLRVHRDRLDPADVTTLGGSAVPITTPSRTLVDLAATLASPRQVERALDEAHALKLLDHRELTAAIGRAHRGARALTAVLAGHIPGTTRTRSGLEEAFVRLCRAHDLPQPLVNQKVGRMTVDFLWPDRRLVVETDGADYHDLPQLQERDRRRDALLTRWRYTVLRVPEDRLEREPDAVAADVRAALRG